MHPPFDELSRKAARGELTAAEQASLDAHLRDHPDARAELEWDEAFTRQLERKIAAMPAMPGWERTERALQAEQASQSLPAAARPARASRTAAARSPGLLDRLSAWLAETLGFSLNLQAVAVALVFAQAGVIGLLAWQYNDVADGGGMRAGTPDPTPRGPLLRVSFRADLREADLRRALAEVGGEIVGGPGQLGVYLVRIKDGDLGLAAQRLRAGGTTELVELVGPKR